MVVKCICRVSAVTHTELTSVDAFAFQLVTGLTEKQIKVPQVKMKAFTD